MKDYLKELCERHQNKTTQLLAILHEIQNKYRHIPKDAISLLADNLDVPMVQVEGTASFYHFFSSEHRGDYTVYLNDSTTSEMAGALEVQKAFEKEVGISFGQTTRDKKIGLYKTSCIGQCDQEPAALINGLVFTRLSPQKVKTLVKAMSEGVSLQKLLEKGEGKKLEIGSEVQNNIRMKGPVFFSDYEVGSGLRRAFELGGLDIIEEMKKSNLRGRGGAGFPTGQKWGFCRAADSNRRYVFCNVDEGEPGTFKDRVLLTERPELVFEGMTVAAYAIEAKRGILYLRGEYAYLKEYLEKVLKSLKEKNLLGKKILGTRFSFDIQIKLGAGAYICGEESALIESAEGHRGQPRNRPPFPVTSGYLHKPTIVNNPETFGCAVRIIEKGADWFKKLGTPTSAGVKLVSVSGDCARPGVYEVEWGITISELLKMAKAQDVLAVQVGGPSGTLISAGQFNRKLAYEDLPTGGSFIIYNKNRDLMSILHNYIEFFHNESCGFCVPCRAGNAILLKKLEKIMVGNGTHVDLEDIKSWSRTIKSASRCGLGQSSPNPLLTAIENFPDYFKQRVRQDVDYLSQFNMEYAVKDSASFAGRTPNLQALQHEE